MLVNIGRCQTSPMKRRLREQWWNAQRFGMTPVALTQRLRHDGAPRVLCITVPKSGTHLLERAICIHPRLYRPLLPTIHEGNLHDHGGLRTLLPSLRPGQILFAHLPHQLHFDAAVRESEVRALLLVRDPRDIAVSEAHYALARPDVPGHSAIAAAKDTEERIRLVIEGAAGQLAPLATRLERFTGWLESGALMVRFEDLVGPAGGGDDDRQRGALRAIYGHLGVPLGNEDLTRLAGRVFSSTSPTFRRGRVGGWHDEFTPLLRQVFDQEAGWLLDSLGYDPAP